MNGVLSDLVLIENDFQFQLYIIKAKTGVVVNSGCKFG